MRDSKTRPAAQRQLYTGLWWCSRTLTLELEPDRRDVYVAMFRAMAKKGAWSLKESQSAAGRGQRACMTFPRGSNVMLASIYWMMRNLTLPWQKKRMTSQGRADVEWGAMMLEANLGRGHYSFELFGEAPPVYTDASNSQAYTGGGWVSGDGEYLWCEYGNTAKRQPIDSLEGDTVLSAVESNGHN
jgi:hypothetical protein